MFAFIFFTMRPHRHFPYYTLPGDFLAVALLLVVLTVATRFAFDAIGAQQSRLIALARLVAQLVILVTAFKASAAFAASPAVGGVAWLAFVACAVPAIRDGLRTLRTA